MVKFLDNFGIKATKGDTIIFPFVVVDNDKQIYQVQTDDVINFGLKKNLDDAECLIEKTIDIKDEEIGILTKEIAKKDLLSTISDLDAEIKKVIQVL